MKMRSLQLNSFQQCKSVCSELNRRMLKQRFQLKHIRKYIIQMQVWLFVIIYFIVCTSPMSFVFKPSWQAEGAGARVIRIIGNQYLKDLDPFLMLDYFKVRLPAGFPDHPHRGFQTVSYMISGSFHHEDFKGHKGTIGPGDLQWMSAGRGIVHSEMPASYEEDSTGFQLWINLESKNKLIQPAYQEFTSDKIKTVSKEHVDVKIISGKWEGAEGPIYARTPSYYFDVKLKENGEFAIPIPEHWNVIVFVYDGEMLYQDTTRIQKEHCCYLEKGQGKEKEIVHKFVSQKGAKFVLIGGQPLNEPISKYGPFVMNTQEQIQQAFYDYQGGKNGFEGAHNWESKIKELAHGKKFEEL